MVFILASRQKRLEFVASLFKSLIDSDFVYSTNTASRNGYLDRFFNLRNIVSFFLKIRFSPNFSNRIKFGGTNTV